MDNLFLLMLLGSLGVTLFGCGQAVKEKVSRKPMRHKNKKLILSALGASVIAFFGFGLTYAGESNAALSSSEPAISQTLETTTTSAEAAARQAEAEKRAAEKAAQEKKLAEKAQEDRQKTEKTANAKLADLAYDGDKQTVDVNDEKPTFTALDLEIKEGGWETYADLDSLNRATDAEALLNQALMPTEKRKSIQNVEPTGWKNKQIGEGYLYNRTHLIGFALSGENDNWKNLITGTQQLNNPEMLRFEMDIKTYLEKDPENYVRYSVVPIFKDDELVARGVHMQAQSINSDEISFNVFIHNIQKDVTINYADGTSETKAEIEAEQQAAEAKKQAEAKQQEEAARQAEADKQAAAEKAAAEEVGQTVYVAPQSGTKYHYDPNCRGLNNANSTVAMDINDAIAQGYTLCGWED